MLTLGLKEVLPGVFWPSGLRVAFCFLVKSRAGKSADLIDTGVSLERPLIARTILRQSLPLKRILLTHSHQDHAGNAEQFRSRFSAEVYCSDLESPYLSGEKKMKPRDYAGSPVFARAIQFGDFLLGDPICKIHNSVDKLEDEDWDFVLIEGHTPGSGTYFHKPTRSAFFGDCLLNCNPLVLPHLPGLHFPFKFFCEDWDAAKMNLARLENCDFENAFFGHGPPIVGRAKDKIMSFLKTQGVVG